MIKSFNKFFIELPKFDEIHARARVAIFDCDFGVNLKDRAAFVIFKIYSRALLYVLPARQICPLVGSVKFDLSLLAVLPRFYLVGAALARQLFTLKSQSRCRPYRCGGCSR